MSLSRSPVFGHSGPDLEYEALFGRPYQFSYSWAKGHKSTQYCGDIQDVTGYNSSELGGDLAGWEVMVHPEDVDTFRDHELNHSKEGALVRSFRIVRKNGDVALCEDRRHFLVSGEGAHHLVVGQVVNCTMRRRAEERVMAHRRELDALYSRAPVGLAVLDKDLRFARINQELADMNGVSPEAHLGRTAWDIVPSLQEAAEPLLQRVLATGQPISGIEFTGETAKLPGVLRYWVEQFYPIIDAQNVTVGVGVICQEVTDQKKAEQSRDFLTRELHHRLKNIYAVISGLVSATARSSSTIAEMAEKLRGRIFALSRAQDVSDISDAREDGKEGPVTMERLLRRVIEPYHGSSQGRIIVSGPAISIPPSMAAAFALCLHELATNSVKHGALGEPDGLINVDWSQVDGTIKLNWNETGPFSLQPPDRTGFGIQIMRQSVVQQLRGTIDFVWNATGVDVRIVALLPEPGAI